MPTIECPNCFAKLDAPAEYKGRAVKCKECGKSFVLRFTGRNKPSALKLSDTAGSPDKSTVSFQLEDDSEPAGSPSGVPAKKGTERHSKPRADKTAHPLLIAPEPWRAAIYQRVTSERFNGDFSAYARTALDALAERLGYPVKPP
jgi:hypothetical protein